MPSTNIKNITARFFSQQLKSKTDFFVSSNRVFTFDEILTNIRFTHFFFFNDENSFYY